MKVLFTSVSWHAKCGRNGLLLAGFQQIVYKYTEESHDHNLPGFRSWLDAAIVGEAVAAAAAEALY